MTGSVTPLTDEQARAAARDPASPAEWLADLAASEDEEIRRLVAANPATPIETLLVLARQHPEEASHNPALRQHLAADPGLLGQLGNGQLAAALAPASQIEALAADPEAFVRKAAGRNFCAPVELVRRLAGTDPEEDVREAMVLVLQRRGEAKAG
jgi:hypothetical protein